MNFLRSSFVKNGTRAVVALENIMWQMQRTLYSEKLYVTFLKNAQAVGQTWDLFVFVHFLSKLHRLRPLIYCAVPPKIKIYSTQFMTSFFPSQKKALLMIPMDLKNYASAFKVARTQGAQQPSGLRRCFKERKQTKTKKIPGSPPGLGTF